MTRLTILFILLAFANFSFSQNSTYWEKESPYEVSWTKDLIISGVAAGSLLFGNYKLKNEPIPQFVMGSFTQADIEKINKFDRIVAGDWDIDAKDKGKIFKSTARFVVPMALVGLPGSMESRAKLALIYVQGRALNGGLVQLAKGTTNRYRPYTYMPLDEIELLTGEAEEEFLEDVVDDDIEDSFFSGDAATTSYGLMFFAKVYNDYYPDSRWKYVVWGTAGIGTGLGAYYRAKSGKHFPSDVIVGSIVGGGLGILLPHLHKSNDSNLSVAPLNNGLSLTLRF